MTVLLVEDDMGFAALVERMLPNHTIVHKIDIGPAIDWLSVRDENAECVVLLDLTLPSSSGIDTFIKLSEYDKRVPIILLTGKDVTDDFLNKALIAGAQEYLQKKWVTDPGVKTERRKENPLLANAIKGATIRKMLENALIDERNEWRAFVDELWFFNTGVLGDGRNIGTDPRAFKRVMARLEAGKEMAAKMADEKIEQEYGNV